MSIERAPGTTGTTGTTGGIVKFNDSTCLLKYSFGVNDPKKRSREWGLKYSDEYSFCEVTTCSEANLFKMFADEDKDEDEDGFIVS